MSMEKFWDALDLSENLRRALGAIRGASGLTAGVMALFVFLVALLTGALAWHFDILSTIQATETVAANVSASLPYQVASIIPLFVLALTFSPTLMELGGAAFAKADILPFQWAVVGLSIFDIFTDAPTATSFLNQYNWTAFGLFEWPAYAISWVIWLGMSSFFFEMISIISLVTTIALVLRSFGGASASAMRGM